MMKVRCELGLLAKTPDHQTVLFSPQNCQYSIPSNPLMIKRQGHLCYPYIFETRAGLNKFVRTKMRPKGGFLKKIF